VLTADEKHILVTGGTGLLGSHLLYALTSEGREPCAIYRKSSNRDNVRKTFGYYSDKSDELYESITWREADILDYKALVRAVKDCHQVYHCASMVSFDTSQGDIVIKNNCEGTANVVKACMEAKVEKLCHVSSMAALGATGDEGLIDETHEWVPSWRTNSYTLSKYLAEDEVWKGINTGLNAVIVAPGFMIGPGNWSRGSASLIPSLAKGMPFFIKGIMSFVDVRDVVKSMIMLTESDISGERFIITSENLSYYEVFRMATTVLGVIRPFIRIPKSIISVGIKIMSASKFLSKETIEQVEQAISTSFSDVMIDNSKIKRATGMTFIPVRKSIEDTARVYLSEKASAVPLRQSLGGQSM
jgi:dihydroflavonol-4-reductase